MKKKIFGLFLTVLCVLVLTCKNPFFKNMLDGESGNEGSGHWNSQSLDDFVLVTTSANGIIGVAPGYPLPGTEVWYKSVFIAGRKVKLSPYMIGKTEVTYEKWYEVRVWAEGNGYTFANKGLEGWDDLGGANYENIGKSPTENKNHPVTMISWSDCIVWCNAYTEMVKGSDVECVYRKKDNQYEVLKNATDTSACDTAYADMDKKGYRLPTEAEWEYAARWQGSDSTNADKYGDVWLTKLNSASGAKDKWDTSETGKVAWYYNNSGGKTHPVGEKRANNLGLKDMSGNVHEWCFDGWNDDPTVGDVPDGDGFVLNPQGVASVRDRVIRCGSWYNVPYHCTVGVRWRYYYYNGEYGIGFRLACRP